MWIGSVDLGLLDHGKENDMSREWKVGDRFTLEYLITKVVEDYVIAEIGDAENILSAEEMALAKLIKPAAPEPQKLDVTKPVRRIWSGNTGRIVGKTLDGKKIVFEHDLGGMCIGPESDFENIPEPKIMGRREAVLLENGSVIWAGYCGDNCDIVIVGRAWVEILEGAGMEEA